MCAATVAACLLGGCGGAPGPPPMAVECGPLPDAREELAQAWQAFQPDRPLTFSIAIRRRLFAFQVLLISAGMYDEPPSAPAAVYAQSFQPDRPLTFSIAIRRRA